MKQKIVMEKVDLTKAGNHSVLFCAGEIPGAEVYHFKQEAGSSFASKPRNYSFY